MSTQSQAAETIFAEALQLTDAAERAAYLERVCSANPQLQEEVESLLAAHEQSGDFLEQPRTAVVEAGFAVSSRVRDAEAAEPAKDGTTSTLAEQPGDRIGRYKMLEQIGEGGFGDVWMAEQEEPVRRRVALKVIKLGMDTKEVVARFEAERQALALMDHPHIAKVFDGGVTENGRPYFVMELVRGIPITIYCDELRLSTRERLELFVQVCQAVQHAHQKGIIHRDLKPSNILVTRADGQSVPKVIDFGIAKATGQRLTEKTLFTRFHQFVGTPLYISPEQAEMGSLDIDTRSDIYSLGVLLYELLTGRTPFDEEGLLRAGLDEMRRTIREKEPVRPSTRLSTLARAELTATAQRRQTEPPKLISLLRGDLDWIVMKCLEKDRSRRYETANGLGMDLQRFLKHKAVLARSPTTVYRLQKFARRNKLAVAAAAAIFIALGAGLAGSLWRFSLEQQARRTAEAAERRSETNLLNAYLAQARANRFSGQVGRRFDGLDALKKALALTPNVALNGKLRAEAIALMALTDVRTDKKLARPPSFQPFSAISPDFELFAMVDETGDVTVRRIADEREVARLPGWGEHAVQLKFSPAGGALVGWLPWRKAVRVWDLKSRKVTLSLTNAVTGNALDWHPRGALLAMGTGGFVTTYDVSSARIVHQVNAEDEPHSIRFSPNGDRLAVASQSRPIVKVFEYNNHALSQTLAHPEIVSSLAWHPDSQTLAAGCRDHRVYLWTAPHWHFLVRLYGQKGEITDLAFSGDGAFLAGAGRDSTVCVWDPAARQLLTQFPANCPSLQFDRTGHRMGLIDEGGSLGILEVVAGTACYDLVRTTNTTIRSASFSHDDRILAVAADRQTSLFAGLSRVESRRITTYAYTAQFTPNAQDLLLIGESGLHRWSVRGNTSLGSEVTLRLEPSQRLGISSAKHACLIPGTRKLAAARADAIYVVDLDSPTNIVDLRGHVWAHYICSSPDGKWLATGTAVGTGVSIWLLSDDRRSVLSLPVSGAAEVLFSPDGRWLVTASNSEYQFWKVGSWDLHLRVSAEPSFNHPLMAFSPDGRILAIRKSSMSLQLLNALDGTELASLPGERPSPLCFNADGSQLVVTEDAYRLRIWDLRLLREELARLNLDWDLPPYLPASDTAPPPPLRIEVVPQ